MLKKLQNVAYSRKFKVIGAAICCMMICCSLLIPFASAAEAVSEPTYQQAAEQVYNSVHEVINFTNILSIIGVGIGGMSTLFLLWWGIRKVIRMLKSGLNGKLKA